MALHLMASSTQQQLQIGRSSSPNGSAPYGNFNAATITNGKCSMKSPNIELAPSQSMHLMKLNETKLFVESATYVIMSSFQASLCMWFCCTALFYFYFYFCMSYSFPRLHQFCTHHLEQNRMRASTICPLLSIK